MLYLLFLIGLQLATVGANPPEVPKSRSLSGLRRNWWKAGHFLTCSDQGKGPWCCTSRCRTRESNPRGSMAHRAALRSEDRGKTWQVWTPAKNQGIGPAFEGSAVQVKDGAILNFDYIPKSLGNGRFAAKRWKSTDQWKTLTGPVRQSFHSAPGHGYDGGG